MINVYTLKNGLRVVMENIPFVRSVSFGIWIKNGSRCESASNNGISHFIEHMMFKGTKKRSAKDIADTMDSVGGQINAFTSKEYKCFYTRTLDTHFDVALDVLTDMFFNSNFDQNDIDRERNVILEEINMCEDTPDDLVHEILQSKIWPHDPLGLTVTGTPESIKNIGQTEIINYVKNNFCPQNTVVALAGNMDENDMLEKITASFDQYKKNTNYSEPTRSAMYTPAFASRDKDIEQVHLCVGFPGIASPSDDIYTVAAISTILGGGMSSRLFQKIREEHGLVYSVYSYHTSFIDTGLFAIYAALNPAQAPDVLQMIIDEVKGMFTNKIKDEQLTKTREQLKSNYLLSLESTSSRMNSIGRTLLLHDKTIDADELINKIDAINMGRFYELCEKIMQLNEISISIVGNKTDLTLPQIG